jgi:hypothetical protein
MRCLQRHSFELTTWSTKFGFQVRPWCLPCINGGLWLLGVALLGAIVVASKKNSQGLIQFWHTPPNRGWGRPNRA